MNRLLLALVLSISGSAWCLAQAGLELDIQNTPGERSRALDPVEVTVAIALPAKVDAKRATQPTQNEENASVVEESQMLGNVLAINSIAVTAAGTLASDYATQADCLFQQQGIRAGQTLAIPCILHPKDESIRKKLVPGLAAIFARSLILQVQVEYMQDDVVYETFAVKRFSVVPPLMSVFYGGMTGALMLALFRGLAPFLSVRPFRAQSRVLSRSDILIGIYSNGLGFLRFLCITLAWLVLGGVCAIMIIILTQASTGELSPIKIEIKDFIGGVLVGLLSFPVVTWLQERLGSTVKEQPGTAPP